jgi:Ca-activated chloride channel family protein
MSFREPALLAALALVPLALAAYVAAQHRGRRYAVTYTNLPVLAAVARRSPLRHVPAALALLALTALALAVARPQRTVAAERREGTVILVSDTSGSMRATDVPPNRLWAAKAAAREFARSLPEDFRLGLVRFSSSAEQVVAPTTDRGQVLAGIDSLDARGGTAMGDGLSLGLQAARLPVPDERGGVRRLPAAIVLLSDGKKTHGQDEPPAVARRARDLKVPIYTVALGRRDGVLVRSDGTRESVPPDVFTLQLIARQTRGRFYATADARRLRTIYSGLGTRLAKRREQQELTAAFAGGALALLLLGSAVGLGRAGRLP